MHSSVTFSDMLHTPYSELPIAKNAEVLYDGVETLGAYRLNIEEPLPLAWLRITRQFANAAKVVVQYHAIQAMPYRVAYYVADALHLRMRSNFTLVEERVGWTPKTANEMVDLSTEDIVYLSKVDSMVHLDKWAAYPVWCK